MRSFEEIRSQVTARQAAEAYGLKIGRSGRALCPWHADHTPDLAFYGDRCYCHACHHGGDAVALAAQVLGLSMGEAARRIARDFHLDSGRIVPPPKRTPQEEARSRYNELDALIDQRVSAARRVQKAAREVLDEVGPDGDERTIRAAMRALARAEDELARCQEIDVAEALYAGDSGNAGKVRAGK